MQLPFFPYVASNNNGPFIFRKNVVIYFASFLFLTLLSKNIAKYSARYFHIILKTNTDLFNPLIKFTMYFHVISRHYVLEGKLTYPLLGFSRVLFHIDKQQSQRLRTTCCGGVG